MSTAMEEEAKRVSIQVTSLSTQLIESIDKQSRLEEQLLHCKKELEAEKYKTKGLPGLIKENTKLKDQNTKLTRDIGIATAKLDEETKLKDSAVEEVSKLQKEVEDLTASLFDEANKMVADARRETYEYSVKNEHLIAQLKERDTLLSSLQTQLKELKDVIQDRDSSTVSIDKSPTENALILYSPTINAVRFDLKFFSDFMKFVETFKQEEAMKSSESKFLKKLIAEDVEPSLRIDLAQGIGWLSKRTLMSALLDGRVMIEPVSGINETYKLNFKNNQIQESDIKSSLYTYPPNSPPVAIDTPCALCNENRNDLLEHSRLYIMKVQASKRDELFLTGTPKKLGNDLLNSQTNSPLIAHQYPLCSYCLFRMRSACELFAFLRSLKTDLWKLDDDISIRKAWIELSRLRSKLFWSKVGIWDLDTNILTTQIFPGSSDPISQVLAKSSNYKNGASNTTISKASSLNESFALNDETKSISVKNDDTIIDSNEKSTEQQNADITSDFLNNYSKDQPEEDDEEEAVENTVKGLCIKTEEDQQEAPVKTVSNTEPHTEPHTETEDEDDRFVDA